LAPHEAITLAKPCTYCGEEVVEPRGREWEHKGTYALMAWGRTRRAQAIVCEDVRVNGEVQKGSFVVRAPYCAQHAEGVKVFDAVKGKCLIVAVVVDLVAFALFYALTDARTMGWFANLSVLGVSLLFAVFIALVASALIGALIVRKKPELRGYPREGAGNWGLSIDGVRTDKGKHGVGPVRYFLRLRFVSPESAGRLLAAYPQAKVTKGEKLL